MKGAWTPQDSYGLLDTPKTKVVKVTLMGAGYSLVLSCCHRAQITEWTFNVTPEGSQGWDLFLAMIGREKMTFL